MIEIFKTLGAINYWNRNSKSFFNTGFIRDGYLNKIKKALDNKLIKVLVGQRRSGKSYLIRQLMEFLIKQKSINPRNIFYLNKELYEFEEINTATVLAEIIELYEKEIKPNGKVYLFIDEVQEITDWEKIIVSLAQHPVKDYEVFISGSNSRLLSGELASALTGRYIVFEIFPFSYSEFLNFYTLDNKKKHFIKYLETSGLPEIYNIESEEIRKHYFQSLKDTILLKDIMYRHKLRDYVLLEDLFLYILHNLGNITSVPSIIRYFKSKNRKTDYTTISAYLTYMEEAYIIKRSSRLLIKTKEILSGDKKYFLNDPGFKNYLFPKQGSGISGLLENIVFLHLCRSGYQVTTGNLRNHEIDFVAEKDESKIYIQVAYLLASEQTIKREFESLEKINDFYPKYVISMDDIKIQSPKGIIHENIWNFINQF